MPPEPTVKRTIAFIDGQNLFYAVKKAFGYTYPNYNPKALAEAIAAPCGWTVTGTFFYTGIPDPGNDPVWNHFWTAKLAVMGTRGVETFSRTLRYRNQTVQLPDGRTSTVLVGQEKGIDVRIALDAVRLARENRYLSEVADEVRAISIQQARWIKIACAFPVSPTSENRRGINRTEWIRIDRVTYDACLDTNDYRPKKS